MGSPRAARAVGQVLRQNPNLVVVPCHCVVRFDGLLGGYVGGKSEKVRLLQEEGLVIDGGRIDLNVYRCQLRV